MKTEKQFFLSNKHFKLNFSIILLKYSHLHHEYEYLKYNVRNNTYNFIFKRANVLIGLVDASEHS